MRKTLFNLKEISAARNYIYGLAILWIVFYHCGINVGSGTVLSAIKGGGDCAVEIFFFLSGICLYFSYFNNPRPLAFYKRRLLRTLPYYLIFYGVVFVYFNLIRDCNVGQFFLNYTMLDFWIHGLGNSPWYLAAILVFYLAYPLILKVFFGAYKHKPLFVMLFLAAIAAVTAVLSVFCPHLRVFSYRIPIFLLGCYAGKLVYEGREFRFWHGLVLFGCLIVSGILFHFFKDVSFVRNVFYLPLALTLTAVASQLFRFNETYCKAVNKPFEYVGTFTLEIYLTHEKTQENVIRILHACGVEVAFDNVAYQLCCIALALGISIGLGLLIRLIISKCQSAVKRATAARVTETDE